MLANYCNYFNKTIISRLLQQAVISIVQERVFFVADPQAPSLHQLSPTRQPCASVHELLAIFADIYVSSAILICDDNE